MEQTSDSDTPPAMLASIVFNRILNQIQSSNLNFHVQISPSSAFISLRKTFVKDKSGTPLIPSAISSTPNLGMEELIAKNHILEKDLSILQKKYEEVSNNCEKAYEAIKELENNQENHAISQKLAAENNKFREIIEEKNVQLDAQREEAFLLHTRLEQNEKESIKHLSEAEDKNAKLSSDIVYIKSQLKEDCEIKQQLKSDASKAAKVIKSHEKNIYNLTKKIDNLEQKIKTLETSKNDVKHENKKLIKEIKILQKNSVSQKMLKTNSTQTEDEINNNNLTSDPCSVQSSSSFTQTDSLLLVHSSSCDDPVTAQTFECVICRCIFHDATKLKEHVENEHGILIDLDKLTNFSEEDHFIRFLKSMNVASDYTEARMQFYPAN